MDLTEHDLLANEVLVAAFVLIAAVFAKRVATHVRRHHPVANRRFMHRYRLQSSRTTRYAAVCASMNPVVRPHQPEVVELPHLWAVKRLHWHGFSAPDALPVVLWSPSAVATWVATETGHDELRQPVLLAAANGDPVNADGVVVESATTDCTYRCVV